MLESKIKIFSFEITSEQKWNNGKTRWKIIKIVIKALMIISIINLPL